MISSSVLGDPLLGTGRALGAAPTRSRRGSRSSGCSTRSGRSVHVTSRPDVMVSPPLPRAVLALPAQALRLERRALRLHTDQVGVAGTVGLAERVAAGDERDGLLVVHRHAGERHADVAGRGQRVGVAVGALGVDVDEAHLDRAELLLELALTGVALVAEPGVLGSPEDLLGLPDVLATEGEAEVLEAHVLHGDGAGEHEQVGPGDLLAVLLLDRPQQPAGLVEVGVVGPGVERGETLAAVAGAAATVVDAVGAGGVPAHPDEEAAVVAEVGGPPVLRGVHDLDEVALEGVDIQLLELGAVVEVVTQRVAAGRVGVQDLEVQHVGPPVLEGVRAPAGLGLRRVDRRVLALAAVRRGRVMHDRASRRRLVVDPLRVRGGVVLAVAHLFPSIGWRNFMGWGGPHNRDRCPSRRPPPRRPRSRGRCGR